MPTVTTYDLSACACCGGDEPGPGYDDDCPCEFTPDIGAYFDIYRDLFGFWERVTLTLSYEYVGADALPHQWVGCATCTEGDEVCVRIRCNPDAPVTFARFDYKVTVNGVLLTNPGGDGWQGPNFSPDGCDPISGQMSTPFFDPLLEFCGYSDVELIYVTLFSV